MNLEKQTGEGVFTKYRSKKKSLFVVERVLEGLRCGTLKIGSKLPSEASVAQQAGVSRTAVREAFSALRIAEVIESRPGNGTYVVQNGASIDTFEEHVRNLLARSESPSEIWESRRILETGIIELVVVRAEPYDLDQIRAALLNMERAMKEKDFKEYLRTNDVFHLAVARGAKNSILFRSLRKLIAISNQQFSYKVSIGYVATKPSSSYSKHVAIFCAIKDKNAQQAKEAVQEHFYLLEDELRPI